MSFSNLFDVHFEFIPFLFSPIYVYLCPRLSTNFMSTYFMSFISYDRLQESIEFAIHASGELWISRMRQNFAFKKKIDPSLIISNGSDFFSFFYLFFFSKFIIHCKARSPLFLSFWWQRSRGDLPLGWIINLLRKSINQKMKKIRSIRND